MLVSAHTSVLVRANTFIQFEVGASYIRLDAEGTVTVSGKTIMIGGDEVVHAYGKQVWNTASVRASIGVGGQNTEYTTEKVTTLGASVTSSADGIHEIVGALVKIN